MKKVLALILTILAISLSAYAGMLPGAEKKVPVLHDISVDSQKSYAVQIPWNAIYIGVFVPDIDASTVGLEVYQHGQNVDTLYTDVTPALLDPSTDTNWVPVLDISDADDAVICASGSDPGFVDITPFVAALRGHWIRITTGSAQTTGDDTWWFVFGSEPH